MNSDITYEELIAMISERPNGHVPTYKKLTESDELLISTPDESVKCYRSGYIAYTATTGRRTVFSVFDCETYTYKSEISGPDITIDKQTIGTMQWCIPIVAYGETRIADNVESMETKHQHFFNEDENIEDFAGEYNETSPVSSIEKYCECLTMQQKLIIELSFVYEYTQCEIAEMLHISRTSVETTIKRSLKKIAKFMQKADFS